MRFWSESAFDFHLKWCRGAYLGRSEVEVTLSVVDPFALCTESLQRITATLFCLLCKTERVAGRADILLLHELDLVPRGRDVFFFLLFSSELAIAVGSVYRQSVFVA